MAGNSKEKNFAEIAHKMHHYARELASNNYSNSCIDLSKSYLNYNLAPDRFGCMQYLRENIEQISPKLRKDGVKLSTWVVDTPKNYPQEKQQEFFQEVYNFLVDRYGRKSGMGEDCVVSAHVHLDETTPHLHFSFMPVIEREGVKAFCAKQVIDKADLLSFHPDLEKYLIEKGLVKQGDINSGITKQQGRSYSIRELKARSRERERSRWRGTAEVEREVTRSRWS